jgi:hypothetical protein
MGLNKNPALSKSEQDIAVEILRDIEQRARVGFQKYKADQALMILNRIGTNTSKIVLAKPNHLRLVRSDEAAL